MNNPTILPSQARCSWFNPVSPKACFALLLSLTAFELGLVGLALLALCQSITLPTFAAAVLYAGCVVYGAALVPLWRRAQAFVPGR